MSTVLPAIAMAGFGFLFYKLITWWTNAPSYIAIIASALIIFVMWITTNTAMLSKKREHKKLM